MKHYIAIAVLLLAAGTAQAQCQGYTSGSPQLTFLTPAQVAAQGGVTATLIVQANTTGQAPSHNLVVTQGVNVGLYWSSNSGSSAALYRAVDNGALAYYGSWTLNGNSPNLWLTGPGDVGHTFTLIYIVTAANGKTTQDRVQYQVVSGANGVIIAQDASNTNYYVQVSSSFSGPSMMHACQVCTQNPGYCNNVHHTPYFSATFTNHTSGEVQAVNRIQAGARVDQNTSLSGSGSLWISINQGDTVDGNVENIVNCDVEGDIYDSLVSWRVEWAQVVVKDLGHTGVYDPADKSTLYDVAPICDNTSDPPDWQPNVVHSWAGRHTYWWGVMSMWRWPDMAGVTWHPIETFLTDWSENFPWNLAQMVIDGGALPYPGPSQYLPIPGKCTKYPNNVLYTFGSADVPFWPWNPPNPN